MFVTEAKDGPWDEVPVAWRRTRLRSLIASATNGAWGSEPGEGNDALCIRAADFDRVHLRATNGVSRSYSAAELAANRLCRGDLLLEKSGGGEQQPVGKAVVFEGESETVCSNFLARLRAAADVDPYYLSYLLEALYLARVNTKYIKQSTGIQNLDYFGYANELVAFPAPEEQLAIVRFLDEETARIDALIAKKERVSQLLDEADKASISEAVLRGLDPLSRSVSRAAGVVRLGSMIRLHRGFDLPDDSRMEGGIPVVSSGGPVGTHNDFRASPPGVVTGRYGSVGAVFFVNQPFWPLNTTLYVSELRGNHARYIYYLLRCLPLRELGAKSAVPGVDRKDVHELLVLRCPLGEQQERARFLDEVVDRHGYARSGVQKGVRQLTEYRSALITAAVTGQADVGSAA